MEVIREAEEAIKDAQQTIPIGIDYVLNNIQKTLNGQPILTIPKSAWMPSELELEERPYWLHPEDYEKEDRAEIEYETIKLTALAKLVFGKELVTQFLEPYEKDGKIKYRRNVRQIWELVNAETQCNETIGPSDEKTSCWLCGFKIMKEEKGLLSTCDHVLPIAQGRFFLDLYNPKYKDDKVLTDDEKSLLRLEYAWAHRFCNNVKLAITFVRADREGGMYNWSVDENNIRTMLNRIINYDLPKSKSSQSFIKGKIKEKYKNTDEWIDSRVKFISENNVGRIVKYLQKNRNSITSDLIGLDACTDESNICFTFRQILKPEDYGLLSRSFENQFLNILQKNKIKLEQLKKTVESIQLPSSELTQDERIRQLSSIVEPLKNLGNILIKANQQLQKVEQEVPVTPPPTKRIKTAGRRVGDRKTRRNK